MDKKMNIYEIRPKGQMTKGHNAVLFQLLPLTLASEMSIVPKKVYNETTITELRISNIHNNNRKINIKMNPHKNVLF